MQNTIESFNALCQAKVWQRYRVANADARGGNRQTEPNATAPHLYSAEQSLFAIERTSR
jgi:hypothetical protein